jgi:hypothetical protein
MSYFTDQKPRIATEKDVKSPWDGKPNGARFRCHLCGHKFVVGDKWRWVWGRNKLRNFIVCGLCDTEDVYEKWEKANKEAEERFWWV